MRGETNRAMPPRRIMHMSLISVMRYIPPSTDCINNLLLYGCPHGIILISVLLFYIISSARYQS